METQGLTQPQVAAALGVSPTTVKRALAKALHAAGGDALAVDGVVAGQSFSARRAVARGGEPWRFAVSGLDGVAASGASAADPATAVIARPAEHEQITAEEIAWLRAEIERRDAALEREQRANADLRHLLLTLGGDPERSERGNAAEVAGTAALDPAALTAIERAAKDAGIGKKQRRALLDRLGTAAGPGC